MCDLPRDLSAPRADENIHPDCPPVLLVVFNRPGLTGRVFERIRAARPRQFFLAADGPRADRAGEGQLCAEVRGIVDRVDWPCEVNTLFRESNVGCKEAVSSAITWFFDFVEEGIILEDDCLPDPSFFRFSAELLERFRSDGQILMISGRNDLGKWLPDNYSYFYTIGNIWGWATWKRAWKLFDPQLLVWADSAAQENMVAFAKSAPALAREIAGGCEKVLQGKLDSWGYPWAFTRIACGGLGVVSAVNLVENIGFQADATHTTAVDSPYTDIPVYSIQFPLRHNPTRRLDYRYYRRVDYIVNGSAAGLVKNIVKKIIRVLHLPLLPRDARSDHAAYDGYSKYDGEVAETYDSSREDEKHWEQEDRYVRKYVQSRSIRNVLDVPVGTGRFIHHYTGVPDITGVDISEEMLAKARQKLSLLPPEVSVRLEQGDVFNLPCEKAAYDVVIVFRLLHLMPEKSLDAAITELCRVSRGDVVVQTYVPIPRSMIHVLTRLLSVFPRIAGYVRHRKPTAPVTTTLKPWYHIQAFYHKRSLIDAKFAARGFVPVESEILDVYKGNEVRVTVYSKQSGEKLIRSSKKEKSKRVVSVPIRQCRHFCAFTYGSNLFNPYENYTVGLHKKVPRVEIRKRFEEFIVNYRPRDFGEVFDLVFSNRIPMWVFPWDKGRCDNSNRGWLDDLGDVPDIITHFCEKGVLRSRIEEEYSWLEGAYETIATHGYQPETYSFVEAMELNNGVNSVYILTDGNHRVSALAALGHREVVLRVTRFLPCDIENVRKWPQVRLGTYSEQDAMKLIHVYCAGANGFRRSNKPAKILGQ